MSSGPLVMVKDVVSVAVSEARSFDLIPEERVVGIYGGSSNLMLEDMCLVGGSG